MTCCATRQVVQEGQQQGQLNYFLLMFHFHAT
jgi:hypothetical protein